MPRNGKNNKVKNQKCAESLSIALKDFSFDGDITKFRRRINVASMNFPTDLQIYRSMRKLFGGDGK